MITIIDYGLGNLRSVQKAFEALGYPAVLTKDKEDIAKATHLVLPGVGAFGAGMRNLAQLELLGSIRDYLQIGRPFLGICLGQHLLFSESEETFGQGRSLPGIGFFPGKVRRFPNEVKIPQIGWNNLGEVKDVPLLSGITNGDYFYFVHSYYVSPDQEDVSLANTEYGLVYPAIVGSGKVAAVQFHPEKSSTLGLKILDNFAQLAVEGD